ncbi:hypothetical protein Syun_002618 [Stephania yunnanensis]|uniref:C2 domain-containing protein n=1 Tax=Stephania yunnanensis TaxID=152371 RepID=A0AAP0LGV3_9MAGN
MEGSGTLEVLLIEAHCVQDKEIFGKMDPYVIIRYGHQEQKSNVARGQGTHPVWNQRLNFEAKYPSGEDSKNPEFAHVDRDTFTKDDFVGDSVVYVKDVVSLGVENGTAELRPTKYRVVRRDKTYSGEIEVGVTFTRN